MGKSIGRNIQAFNICKGTVFNWSQVELAAAYFNFTTTSHTYYASMMSYDKHFLASLIKKIFLLKMTQFKIYVRCLESVQIWMVSFQFSGISYNDPGNGFWIKIQNPI